MPDRGATLPSRPAATRDPWPYLGLLMVAAAVAAAAFQATTSRYILRGGGCGFDGEQYCAMARGLAPVRPYNRRPLLPWVVRAGHLGTVLHRFLVVDLVSILAVLVFAYLLVRTLGGSRGQGIVLSALVLLDPWTLHISLSYPALTDEFSLALGLAWLLVALGDRSRWWSLPLAVATILAREQWALPLLVAVLLVAWYGRSRRVRVWAVTSVAAIAATTAVDFTQPYSPGPSYSVLSTVRTWISQNFGSTRGIVLFAWFLVVGLGLVPALLASLSRRALLERDTVVVLGTGASHLVLATFGGGDTNRLVLPTFVLLGAVAFAHLGRRGADVFVAGVACLGTVLVFRPWSVIRPHVGDFIAGWSQRAAPWSVVRPQITRSLVQVAIPLLVVAGSMAAGRVRGGPAARWWPVAAPTPGEPGSP